MNYKKDILVDYRPQIFSETIERLLWSHNLTTRPKVAAANTN